MKPSLAVSYAMKRRSKMAKGGMVNPKLEESTKCAHGGPIMCAMGCYDEGGEVEGMDKSDDNVDMSMDERGLEKDDVEMGDLETDPMAEEKAKKMSKGGMLLTKILGRISKHHKGE